MNIPSGPWQSNEAETEFLALLQLILTPHNSLNLFVPHCFLLSQVKWRSHFTPFTFYVSPLCGVNMSKQRLFLTYIYDLYSAVWDLEGICSTNQELQLYN